MDKNERGDLLQQEGYRLMGAAFEVYNEMGQGFLEEVYQESMEKELALRSIPFQSKVGLKIFYKKSPLEKRYIPDLIAFEGIIVELKAVQQLAAEHEAQLLNYLKATGMRVGYLVNFGSPHKLEWKRMVR